MIVNAVISDIPVSFSGAIIFFYNMLVYVLDVILALLLKNIAMFQKVVKKETRNNHYLLGDRNSQE